MAWEIQTQITNPPKQATNKVPEVN